VWQRPSAERQAAHVQLLSTPMHKRAGSYAAGLALITGGSNRSLQRLSDGSRALQAAEPEQDGDDAKLCASAIAEGNPDKSGLLAVEPAASTPAGDTTCCPTASCSCTSESTLLLRNTAIGRRVLHHHPCMTVRQALQWLKVGLVLATEARGDGGHQEPPAGQKQNCVTPAGTDQQQQMPRSPRSPRGRARSSRPCSPFWCFSQSSQTWSDEEDEEEEEEGDEKQDKEEEQKHKKSQPKQVLSSSVDFDQQVPQRAAVSFELDDDNQLFMVAPQAAPQAPGMQPSERHLVTGVVVPEPHSMTAGSSNVLELVTPATRHEVQLDSEYDWTGLLAGLNSMFLMQQQGGVMSGALADVLVIDTACAAGIKGVLT